MIYRYMFVCNGRYAWLIQKHIALRGIYIYFFLFISDYRPYASSGDMTVAVRKVTMYNGWKCYKIMWGVVERGGRESPWGSLVNVEYYVGLYK